MYSKCQIIKILENCFQSMNCFSWTKLIFVPIHLKYWCYNSAHLELHSLTISVKLYTSQLKPLFSTILIVFFIGFPIFPTPFNHTLPQVLNISNHMPRQVKQMHCIIKLILYTLVILHVLILLYKLLNNPHQKYFPTWAIEPISAASRDQEARKSCEDWTLTF